MLCHDALGHSDEFERLAAANQVAADSPLSYFAKAALDFSRSNPEGAEELLAAAAHKFSDPNSLAPWNDTLIEYGWHQLPKN